jgi:predicted ATPase
MKSIESIDLDLRGLTVLIGDNGTGKSTILEALELLRVSVSPEAARDIRDHHGGTAAFARHDVDAITLGATLETNSYELDHEFHHGPDNRFEEILRRRTGSAEKLINPGLLEAEAMLRKKQPDPADIEQDSNDRQLAEKTLAGIAVHLPFDVSASWAARQHKRTSTVRGPQALQPTKSLHLYGTNLANVYHTLKNEYGAEHWRNTMELVQLGLGHDVSDIAITAADGGKVSLAVDFGSTRVLAFALADGVLTYLAFVALVRLDAGRSLLAFDEPETHLHPALLTRVVDLLEDAAQRYPVVLSTHSDQLLDCLSDPVGSVVVCELDRDRCTRLRRLDPEQFDKWRDDYRGVGNIRAEGQLRSILRESEEP